MNTIPETLGLLMNTYTYAIFAVILICVVLHFLRVKRQKPGSLLLSLLLCAAVPVLLPSPAAGEDIYYIVCDAEENEFCGLGDSHPLCSDGICECADTPECKQREFTTYCENGVCDFKECGDQSDCRYGITLKAAVERALRDFLKGDEVTIVLGSTIHTRDVLQINDIGNLTIDLHDHGLIRNAPSTVTDGSVISINNSDFTLTDTSQAKGGYITGGTGITDPDLGNGGGVHVISGSFTMEGGKITNNEAHKNGGGVYVDSSAIFNMKGGEISLNMADDGGGVYVASGGVFNMSGGTITGNKGQASSQNALGVGGVYAAGTFNISGADGSVNISGNQNCPMSQTQNCTEENIYLPSGKKINITGTVEGSDIGVFMQAGDGQFAEGSGDYTLTAADAAAFKLDGHPGYAASLDSSGNVILFEGILLKYDANDADSGAVPAEETAYISGDTVTVLGNTGDLAKDGFNFTGWNTKADGTGTAYAAGDTFTISADTTLYARWAGNVSYLIVIPEEVDFGTLSQPDDGNTPAYKTVEFPLTADKIEDLSEGFKLVVSVKGEGENNQFFIANDADSSVKLVFEVLVNGEVLDVSGANGGKVAAFTASGQSEVRILRLDQVQLVGKPLAQIVGDYSGTMVFYSRLE